MAESKNPKFGQVLEPDLFSITVETSPLEFEEQSPPERAKQSLSMKNIVFIFSLFLLGTCPIFSQTAAFSLTTAFSNLDGDQNKVAAYVGGLSRIGDIRYINWASAEKIAENGTIMVSLPNENGGQPILFNLLDADFASPSEYALYGTNSLGNISLYTTAQGTGGTIDQSSRSYSIFPLGGTKAILIENGPSNTSLEGCGTGSAATESISYCDTDCGEAIVDVLALVTPGTRTWLNANYGIFGQWFLFVETHNINGAFVNSAITGKRVRTQIVDFEPDFTLTGFDIDADLTNLKVSTKAQQLADQYGADIRVILTELNYPGIAGAIPGEQGDPTGTNKVGIVEVQFIGSIRYTFAHELAHHFGCWHSQPLFSECRNGMYLSTNNRNTIMANGPLGGAANNSRIQHFSNPDVTFAGEATGVDGIRDNAAQLRGAFCEVANNTPAQYGVRLSRITPGPLCVNETHKFTSTIDEGTCALMFGSCSGPYQFQWRASNNPGFTNSVVIGNTQTVTYTNQFCPLYLHVTVTNSFGMSITSTKLFNCASSAICDGLLPGPTDRSDTSITPNYTGIRCLPNPANDKVMVLCNDITPSTQILISDINGRVTSPNIHWISDGQALLDINTLTSGIWILTLHLEEEIKTTKISVVK